MTGKTPVEAITHDADRRANIPPAELEPVLDPKDRALIKAAYARRDPDLDPQVVWRGKDMTDWSDLVVDAPPIYLQEQIHPKALIEDLRASARGDRPRSGADLFEHFGIGAEDREAEVEFYRHSRRWSNRMILGDALQVMASLAEREGLRGRVQAIYIDPPYGIRVNSNFQWSTTSRDVKDGALGHLTREPEQVKAFRDTWRDGVHSYLTYLRDRLTVARELLTESGSCFVQIGDENVHRVRALMDEVGHPHQPRHLKFSLNNYMQLQLPKVGKMGVDAGVQVFGEENFCSSIFFSKNTGTSSGILPSVGDQVLWYARSRTTVKFRQLLRPLPLAEQVKNEFKDIRFADLRVRKTTKEERDQPSRIPSDARLFRTNTAVSPEPSSTLTCNIAFRCGIVLHCGNHRHWKTKVTGMLRLERADRLDFSQGPTRLFRRFLSDSSHAQMHNVWGDTRSEQQQVT